MGTPQKSSVRRLDLRDWRWNEEDDDDDAAAADDDDDDEEMTLM